jgi:hypothetical protein
MNDYKFKDGMKLKTIICNDGGEIRVDRHGIVNIVVIMQCGQISEVAWALVESESGMKVIWNLALVQGVEFLEEYKDGGK